MLNPIANLVARVSKNSKKLLHLRMEFGLLWTIYALCVSWHESFSYSQNI